MSLTLPPARNYSSPVASYVSNLFLPPIEGNRYVPIEILWASMGGPNNCVAINLYGGGAQTTLSQIISLSVDNSLCGADIQFLFPDSGQTYTVPAYEPAVVFPVTTNATNFYVLAEFGEEPIDITRFAILNYLAPPSAVPSTREQVASSSSNLALASTSTDTQLIATGITGTLELISLRAALISGVAGGWSNSFFMNDGDGKRLASGVMSGNNTALNVTLIDLPDVNIRFHNGVTLTQSAGVAITGFLAYNLLYRTP